MREHALPLKATGQTCWASQSEAMRRVSVSKYARLRTEFADREDRMKDETHKIKSVIPPTGSHARPYAVQCARRDRIGPDQ
jgi:hypothetical protein